MNTTQTKNSVFLLAKKESYKMPRVLDLNANFCIARDEMMLGSLPESSRTAQEPILPRKSRLDTEVFHNDIGIRHLSSTMLPLSINDTFRFDSNKLQNTKTTTLSTPKHHRPITPIEDICINHKFTKSILTSHRSPERIPSCNELLSIERLDRLLKLRRRRNLQHFREGTRDENAPRDGSFLRKRLFDAKENKLPEDIFVPMIGGESENGVHKPSKFILKPRMKHKTLSPRNNNRPALQSIENRPRFPKAA